VRLIEGTIEVEDVDALLSTFAAVSADTGATVQAVDADYVVDREHLTRAVELADRAIERGENVARNRAVEILLYAAGRRQIDDALEMGLTAGPNRAVILIDGGDEAAAVERIEDLVDPEPTLGTYDREAVRAFFDVTDAELRAVEGDLADLVRERVALLPVEK